jgi:hypothetical protein
LGVKISLFHEPWWLSATTGDKFQEAVVKRGDEVTGRLPYITKRRGPFNIVRMPPFTHMLGPVVDAGEGKHQTRLMRRLSITRSLIDQLPPNFFFHQHLDPSIDDGLALADGLAFQERKFGVSAQYTFEIDCRQSLDEMWAAMYLKTRQHTRRAEKAYSVRTVDDPQHFISFYLNNLETRGLNNRIDFSNFPALFGECQSRSCAHILGAFDHDNSPVAMTFVAWGHGTMYYLLSTRSSKSHDLGSNSLLLWSAMKRANELKLVLDLDGVYSSGTSRFLNNFGGKIKTRLTIHRTRMPYTALQFLKRSYAEDESQFFT